MMHKLLCDSRNWDIRSTKCSSPARCSAPYCARRYVCDLVRCRSGLALVPLWGRRTPSAPLEGDPRRLAHADSLSRVWYEMRGSRALCADVAPRRLRCIQRQFLHAVAPNHSKTKGCSRYSLNRHSSIDRASASISECHHLTSPLSSTAARMPRVHRGRTTTSISLGLA